MYNLEIYPIHIHEGSAEDRMPGLISLVPPRKCARGRESDQLIAFIHLTGNTNITPAALDTWLQKKAALFYSAPGSVTSAMRLMAEAINNELLDRNLKKATAGSQVNGSLSLVVIRKDVVYSVIIGQARLFHLTRGDVVEWADMENHARGLGVSQSITCLFNQNPVASGDSLLLAPLGSPLWTRDALQNAFSLKADALGRRLLSQHPTNLHAALVRLSDGKGTIEVKSILPQQQVEAVKEVAAPETPAERVQGDIAVSDDTEELRARELRVEETALPLPGVIEPVTENQRFVERSVETTAFKANVEPSLAAVGDTEEEKRERRRKEWREAKKAQKTERHKGEKSVKDPKPKKVKVPNPDAITVPRYLYLLLAIAVPIVVVIIAASVYINQGRSQQFNYYLDEGRKYAEAAELVSEDPVMHSFNLQAALMYLQKANQYGVTEEATGLLTTVQAQLDQLQGVVRLTMNPLETNQKLGSVNITQMVATNTDLYALDSNSGKALHFDLLGEEFIHDEGFDCGPNPNNPLNSIGKLVDIIGLPTGNSFGATLFGIDAYGNVEFCIPEESGVVSSLIAPDAGWQEIKAISMFQNYLYVLDPGNNGVFMYYGRGILFEDKPVLFFDNVIPEMKSAVDIEVYADELYVLRSSGEMVECTYSYMKDYKLTECTDPAPYRDTRAGQDPETVTFSDSQFIQMRMTPAPDSSLYLLDAHGNGIYHFSLLRNLQKILQPGFSDPEYAPKKPVTSVAFSPGRTIFLAFGNQIFTATMP